MTPAGTPPGPATGSYASLAAHELNRGVFVRIPSAADVTEVYRSGRIVECAALRDHPTTDTDLGAAHGTLARADRCAAQGDWVGVGTADAGSHRAVTALDDNRLLGAPMAGVRNELRPIFHVVSGPGVVHEPYLRRNHEAFDTPVRGEAARAADILASYLGDAQSQILAAYPEIVPNDRASDG